MTSQELERLTELADIALQMELLLDQIRHELKMGNTTVAATHAEKAHRYIHRLENEIGGKEI